MQTFDPTGGQALGPDGSGPDGAGAAAFAEARRTLEICNACRYCESYCAVFPAMTLRRAFSDGDLSYLANLCHNCRGCYYACQYAPPHDFALNLPVALAEVRHRSWADYAWPSVFARAFRANAAVLTGAMAAGVALMLLVIAALDAPSGAAGFYALIPHDAMLWLFAPAFLFALLAMGVGVARFWRDGAPSKIETGAAVQALHETMALTHLGGGHGEGCNYEDEDRFSNRRRRLHHLVFYGFLLCFASTASGTVLHYGFDAPAPYGLLSLPKLLGVPGGVLLCLGAAGLWRLKRLSDPAMAARDAAGRDAAGMESAFLGLLFWTGFTGLTLYALRETPALAPLLALHLGCVFAFFVTMPYSKMVHGLYRGAALLRAAQERRSAVGRPAGAD